MWSLLAALVLLAVLFLAWRITSVGRGARQRDDKILALLDPLGQKLSDRSEVAPAEVRALCDRPELRPMLYGLLQHFERLDLFPDDYTSWERQAEGLLAYWMMHPNELNAAPKELECRQRVEREIDGKAATFLVLRFRMPSGHWAGDRWLVGLAGPFLDGPAPYSGPAGAFSRASDTEETTDPQELVDWFIAMCRSKGLAKL